MKRLFVAALLSSTFYTPGFAAQVELSSAISAVTVYPRGAQVTRSAKGMVPKGSNVIVIRGLPGELLKNSVRVEGKSGAKIEIGSIDVRQVYLFPKDNHEERLKIKRQIEELADEVSGLDQLVQNTNSQRAMLQQLASRAILPRPTDNGGSVVISATELNELLNLTAERFKNLSTATEQARVKKRELTRKITQLQHRYAAAAPEQEKGTVISINLSAQDPGDAVFLVRYNIQGSGWAPVYDAKLSLGKDGKNNKVKIVRRADVYQTTTEKWQNVFLTLSTARPSASTKAPKLAPYILSQMSKEYRRRQLAKPMADTFSANEAAPEAMVARSPKLKKSRPAIAIGRAAVAVSFSGFQAEYKIPGKVSVANVGQQKSVIIGQSDFPAEISATTTPKLEQAAYLTAKIKIAGDAPYLPGQLLLSRDGVFLGRGRLPQLNAGQDHTISFGRDDFVKVKRTKVTEQAGESGFVSKTKDEIRNFVTTLENLHDFPINVIVNDHMPYATHEDIKVEMIARSTKPTKTNVKNKRGLVQWQTKLEAKSKYTINFGYKVSWPKNMRITPVR